MSFEALIKDFGNIFHSVDQIKEDKKSILQISPAFDIESGGGIPEGCFVGLGSPPKLGKSVLSLYIAGKAQKLPTKKGNKRVVFYFDVEHRLKPRDYGGIKGLDTSPDVFQIIRSSEEELLNSKNILEAAERVAKDFYGSVLIIDSFSALCSEDEQTGELGKEDRGRGNKIVSQFCRRMAGIVPVNNNIVIGLTQVYANTSGYGAAFKEKVSTALVHAEDVKLFGKSKSPVHTGKDSEGKPVGKPIGHITEWVLDFSALGPPGKIQSHYLYGTGIDEVSELVIYATDLGFIEKKGSWFVLDIAEDKPKVQGEPKMIEMIRSNPTIFHTLAEKVYSMYGLVYDKEQHIC